MRRADLLAAVVAGLGIAAFAQIALASASVALPFSLPRWSLLVLAPVGALAGIAVAGWLKRWAPVLFQVAKFGLVGTLSTTIDLGVLNLLMEGTGISRGALFPLLKGLSFCVALVNAFVWNRQWTFRQGGRGWSRRGAQQFALFATVAVGGLVLNVTVATLFVNLLPLPSGWQPIQWANLGALSALVATATWDFLCYKFIVFRFVKAAAQAESPTDCAENSDLIG